MKIFFFGGTFDPPHNGHQSIIEYSLPLCDKLIIVPTKKTPDKNSFPIANYKHRCNMLELIANDKKIEISNFEIKSNEINYTYFTIMYLKEKYKNCSLSMIIGKDQLLNLHTWKNYEQIISMVHIICFNRYVNLLTDDSLNIDKIEFIDEFKVDISSTTMRKEIYNEKEDILNWMNSDVIKYIKDNKLYA